MPRVDAIDLSHWNTVKNFSDVERAGVVGVIHKASEGDSYVDDDYASRKDAAFEAGLLWGAYHFMRPGDMREQMKHFVGVADLPPGSRMCLDHEDPTVSLDDLKEAVKVLKELMDCEVAIYSGHVIKDQLGDKYDQFLAENTSLWLAQYTSGQPDWPKTTWPTYSLWQFTDSGSCDGISGDCDLNTFAGDKEACAKWFGPVEDIEPGPSPEPGTSAITIDINTDGDVAISLTINGKNWVPG